jgi:DNA-binding transcriptional regulator GbsR (MarR family)
MSKKVDISENRLCLGKQELIERMAYFTERRGGTPMNGRVFGLLLVANPPSQDSFSICNQLNASKGAVSNALNELIALVVVKSKKKRGDRTRYLHVDPEA